MNRALIESVLQESRSPLRQWLEVNTSYRSWGALEQDEFVKRLAREAERRDFPASERMVIRVLRKLLERRTLSRPARRHLRRLVREQLLLLIESAAREVQFEADVRGWFERELRRLQGSRLSRAFKWTLRAMIANTLWSRFVA